MPEPQQTDIFDSLGKLSKGLTAVKEVWAFASRMAALQQQYPGKPVPADKFFLTMFGFVDKPNPLAFVEKQLAEINAKLDRVLLGIDELKIGQLGQNALNAYLRMKTPANLIETYFANLVKYQRGKSPWKDTDREEFVDKLTGRWSERDSVAFNALEIVNLNPATGAPLFFDLFFAYLSAGAIAANATQIYVRGAFAFRAFGETLSRALILELFAIASPGGDPATVAADAKTVTEKYRQWLMDSIERNLLPFAEKLATYNFKDEYLGGHDTSMNAHRTRQYWRPAKPSILQSADELAARLIGKTRSLTLRVIPNVPPIVDKTPTQGPPGVVSAGRYEFEITKRPQSSLTTETLLDKLESSRKNFFEIVPTGGRPSITAESVKKVDGSFAERAAAPVGFDKRRLSFLRYQFDLGSLGDGAEFQFGYDNVVTREFPTFETTWRKVYVEEGRRFPEPQHQWEIVKYPLMTHRNFFIGYFKLPSEGQLSPVLVTFAYATYGPPPK
jgi:hypothetical protein